LTSAPGGFDSNRTVSVRTDTVPVVSVEGDELKKFKLRVDAEHAATVKPHAITAMTRLISDPTTRTASAAYPTRTIRRERSWRPLAPIPSNANSLEGQSLTSLNLRRISL
jgi:hypothetical protein